MIKKKIAVPIYYQNNKLKLNAIECSELKTKCSLIKDKRVKLIFGVDCMFSIT